MTGESDLDRGSDLGLRAIAVAISLFGIGVFGVVCHEAWNYTIDDAFIWFRYAQNLAEGYGPTFNRVGPVAEGYTGFLWLWIMAIPHWLGLDPVAFSKVVGVACGVGTIATTLVLAWRLASFGAPAVRWLASGFAVLFLGTRQALAVHSVSGMETAFYTFMLTLFFALSVAFVDRGRRRLAAWLPVCGLLVALSRPEGVLVVAVTIGVLLLQSDAGLRRVLLVSAIRGFVIPGAIYFGWRLWYYGLLFPLPFYISTLTGRGGAVGSDEFLEFVTKLGVPVAILLPLGLARSYRRVGAAAAAATALALFFLIPTHRASYHDRYFFPVIPLIHAICGCGLATLIELIRTRAASPALRRSAAVGCALAAMALFAVFERESITPASIDESRRLTGYYDLLLRQRHIRFGRHLARITPHLDHDPILAIADAGAAPYYSGWRTIDSFGLNDPHIAVSGEHDPDYVLSQHPDLVVILSWADDPLDPILPWEGDLYDAALAAGMEKIRVYGPSFYALVVLGDPDSEVATRLKALP